MALIDFGTVQVYEMDDMVEVVFPFDKAFGGFLGTMGGRWSPQRKCYRINPVAAKKSPAEITSAIHEQLKKKAPKNWEKILEILRGHGCVTTKFEVFAGTAGVRFTLPLGHPCHHHLRAVKGLENNKKQWLIPAQLFPEKVVRDALARIYNEDQKKFLETVLPVEERCLVGQLAISEDQQEAYNLKKGNLVAGNLSLLLTADPAMATSDVREFAFEVLKCERLSAERVKVSLEYVSSDEGYDFLKKRVYAENSHLALDHGNDAGEKWVQRRS